VTRVLPDPSCLVAAVCAWHEHHEATAVDLERRSRQRETLVMAAPVLLEAYAVLTRLPPPHRLRPPDALAVLDGSFGSAEVVVVPPDRTWALLRDLPGRGVAGGGSSDAMIVACAEEAGADAILTWHPARFERLTDDIEIASPSAP
jgi:predicted nucleic acid-binding protein